MAGAPTILITGAAGNLGSRLTRHLLAGGHAVRAMVHRTPLAEDLGRAPNLSVAQADLDSIATLPAALRGVDVVVHLAGVLFAPRPGRFLPRTNTRWFSDLLTAALDEGIARMILISFPHVEGPTRHENPATGRLDRSPISIHARTRLAEERLLMERTAATGTTPVVLRLGMVYGPGILMIEAARRLARRRLLGVWRDPTWIQLIATADCLRAIEASIVRPSVKGIYHIGDEQPVTLQQFLDAACDVWGSPHPFRMPAWLAYTAAALCEAYALAARTSSPLTRDFIRIGRVSYWGDTRRAREDLIQTLEYPTLKDGIATLGNARGRPSLASPRKAR